MKTISTWAAAFAFLLSGVEVSELSALDLNAPVRAVVFESGFETDSLGAPLGRWRGQSPAWRVTESPDRALAQSLTDEATHLIFFEPSLEWTDYTLECVLRVHRWGGQTKHFNWNGSQDRRAGWGVAVRIKDAGNMYRLEYAPWVPEGDGGKQSFYRLVKYKDGARSELARVISRFHSDMAHNIKIVAAGPALKAKVWPAGEREPSDWTIAATDSDLAAGGIGLAGANVSMLYDRLKVENASGQGILSEDFQSPALPEGWRPLSGRWEIAASGRCLAAQGGAYAACLTPVDSLNLPAALTFRLRFSDNLNGLVIDLREKGKTSSACLVLQPKNVGFKSNKSQDIKCDFETGRDYSVRLSIDKAHLTVEFSDWPVPQGPGKKFSFDTGSGGGAICAGFSPQSSHVTLDDLTVESTVSTRAALREYLRYICDWYVSLDLPSGYPKTGTGSPEIFIASYCARTLAAGGLILEETRYLEEAFRWSDFVTGSPSILVPVTTGKGNEALALRTFADHSDCINLADIGSVMLAVGVISPKAGPAREGRYLDVMEKYSRYVIEGCIEDPLVLNRGSRPQGWRITEGSDRGGFANGYWWMELQAAAWDVSTTTVGLQFYPVLHSLTGNPDYSRFSQEALDWYLEKEIRTGNVFESYHDVIYGGEALLTYYEYSDLSDKRRAEIDSAVGVLCDWIVEHQNADGTWDQADTPRNNRTNLVWQILNWYGRRHPENERVRMALDRVVRFYLNRDNSRWAGVCEVLRKTCFTGISVADLLDPGVTLRLERR